MATPKRRRPRARCHGRERPPDGAIFDRYNIVSEDDLAAAMDRTDAYVTERRAAKRRVVPIDAGRGQKTDNPAVQTAISEPNKSSPVYRARTADAVAK